MILAEYPGYGGRRGQISENSMITDAVSVVQRVHEQYKGPIYLLGESLGCGVAAGAAAAAPVPLNGLILITPWDTLPDLAQSLYWYLPARYLVQRPL